jgi:hypothetical protein
MSFDAAPPAAFEARHFDGLTPESRPVRARVAPDGVWLEDEAGARRWELAELVLVRGDARGEPVQLERRSDPVEVLIVQDRAFLAALRAALPAGARLTKRGAWTPPARAVAGLVLAAVALILVIYRFAIPALADFAADHVPAAWSGATAKRCSRSWRPSRTASRSPRCGGRRRRSTACSRRAPESARATRASSCCAARSPTRSRSPGETWWSRPVCCARSKARTSWRRSSRTSTDTSGAGT